MCKIIPSEIVIKTLEKIIDSAKTSGYEYENNMEAVIEHIYRLILSHRSNGKKDVSSYLDLFCNIYVTSATGISSTRPSESRIEKSIERIILEYGLN